MKDNTHTFLDDAYEASVTKLPQGIRHAAQETIEFDSAAFIVGGHDEGCTDGASDDEHRVAMSALGYCPWCGVTR